MRASLRLVTIVCSTLALAACKDSGSPATDAATDVPDGAARDGGSTDLCAVPASCPVLFSYPKGSESSVELRGSFNDWSAGVPLVLSGSTWQATVELDHGREVQYKFLLDGTSWVNDPQNPRRSNDSYQNSVLDVVCPARCDGGAPADSGPTGFDWADAVMYFVLLDRFLDGDSSNNAPEPDLEPEANWRGGDLQGLLTRIRSGYFQTLGVNVLWISSPVDVPSGKYPGDDGHDYTGYHGYWPSELQKVEEHLGDLSLLQQVVSEAHQRGIRVVMDYVMNHVHEQSPVYLSNKGWFWPLEYQGKTCVCGGGCSWDSSPERERCWFRSYLPDFDFRIEAARQHSVGNAIYWAKTLGLDGFRLDAVKHIEMSWITDLRAELKQQVAQPGQRFYLVGETFTGDKPLLKSYVDPQTKLDGQFDFPLRATLVRTILMRQGSLRDLETFLSSNDGYYGSGALMGTFLGNHDLPRAIHLAEDQPQFDEWDGGKSRAWVDRPAQPDYDRAYQRLGVAFAALFTLPGVPLIYYGDEVGLAGAGDPDSRRLMPWTGLSANQEWLRTLVGKLTQIRAAHPALRRGWRKEVWLSDDVYGYRMMSGSDQLIVVLNRSDTEQTIQLQGSSFTDLLDGSTVTASSVCIPARSARILK